MIRSNFKHAAVALTLLVGSAGTALAGWGAVGIGPYGAYGYAYGQPNENAAWNRVQNECGGNCDNIKTFVNDCGAMAQDPSGAWGFGRGNNQSQAENSARGFCAQYGGNQCTITVWACN